MRSISDIAEKYIGTKEWSSRHIKIVQIYNHITPLPRGYTLKLSDNWCAGFVSVMISEAGGTGPFECSANRLRTLCKHKVKTGKKDDLIFYDWNTDGWSDHVGIISEVKDNKYIVIEGNYRNSVGVRWISVNSSNIQGIYRIDENYNVNNNEKKKKKALKTIAQEVIKGKWGNGQERKEKLKKAGYDPDKVQEAVNKMI